MSFLTQYMSKIMAHSIKIYQMKRLIYLSLQGRLQGFNRTGAQFEESQRLGIRIFNLIQDIPNFYLKSWYF